MRKYIAFIAFTADFKEKPFHLCILQYSSLAEVSNVGMRPHKNAKDGSGLPYVRTKKSVLVQIENEAKASKPMHVFDKVYKDCGGVVGAESCGSIPRNKKQVSNVKRSINQEPRDADPLFAVIGGVQERAVSC